MRAARAFVLCCAGLAACATPGQVRRVETAVALADHERARSDSAQRVELARIQIALRQAVDSMTLLNQQLNDVLRRVISENASNNQSIMQSIYQVSALASTTQSGLKKLTNQVDLAVASAPVTNDTAGRGGAAIPPAALLISQAVGAINSSAYPSARRSLTQVLTSYPQSPQVPDALFWFGYSYEREIPDSARVYYNRVWSTYPQAEKAPTALYKLGNLELAAGNIPQARKYWQQLVDNYKTSLEYEQALALLRAHP